MYMNLTQSNESTSSQNQTIGGNYHRLQFLPSKKILILIAGIVIVVCGFFLYPHITSIISKIFTQPIPTKKQPVVSVVDNAFNTDTDGDSIPDWQETLFDLNPAASDSDGDGIVDTIPTELDNLSENPSIVTTTDKLSLAIYQNIQSSGVTDISDPVLSRATAQAVLDTANTLDQSFTRYPESKLSIIIASPENKTSYAKKIAPFLKDLALDEKKSLLLTSQISKRTFPADVYITKLTSMSNRLLKTAVIHDLTDEQLNLINALSVLAQIYKQPPQTEQTAQYLELLVIKKNVNVIVNSLYNINLYLSLN